MQKLLCTAAALALAAGPAFAQPPPPPGPHGPWGPKEQHEMMMRMMHERAGDSFRFKKGDDEVDIHCSDQQPVQACVEAATRIMQQLQSMKESSSGSGSSSGTSSTTH